MTIDIRQIAKRAKWSDLPPIGSRVVYVGNSSGVEDRLPNLAVGTVLVHELGGSMPTLGCTWDKWDQGTRASHAFAGEQYIRGWYVYATQVIPLEEWEKNNGRHVG